MSTLDGYSVDEQQYHWWCPKADPNAAARKRVSDSFSADLH